MRRRAIRGSRPALALLVLAALVSVMAADFLPHTDDGCQAEVHCVACRTVLGRDAVASSHAVALLQQLHAVGTVVERPGRQPDLVARDVAVSRGPPLAS